MIKVAFKLLLLILLFFGTWFILSRINWVSLLKVERATKSTEIKIGELSWRLYSRNEHEISSSSIKRPITILIEHLCRSNSIDPSKIKLHLLQKDEINAFALPDNHLVIYSGLIVASKNEAELLGVLSHEIAHLEKGHVMRKLIKEVGLSVITSITAGGNMSTEAAKKIAKLLSSTAYDRDLETEADKIAVDYLLKAEIDPKPFANFLSRFTNPNLPDQAYWISTHPDSKERTKRILKYIENKRIRNKPILQKSQWLALKNDLEEDL